MVYIGFYRFLYNDIVHCKEPVFCMEMEVYIMREKMMNKDYAKAFKTIVIMAVLLALLGGFAVACVGERLAEPLMGLLNVPEDVSPLALLYLRIYLAGMPVILLYTRRNNSNFRCYCKYGISKSGNYRCKRSFYIYHCSK